MKSANNYHLTIANPPDFWKWFRKHQEKFKYPSRLTRKDDLHWNKKICSTLQSYSLSTLFVDLSVDEQNGHARMIISAHGDKQYFDMVELFVAAAPEMEGWEFVALYPPVPAGASIRHNYPSVTTTPAEIFFSPPQLAPVNGMYDLILYIDEKVPVNWEVKGAATQMMYNLLGEKTGGMYIRKVAVSSLEAALPELRQTFLPMTQLPEYIKLDNRSGLVVNPRGNIKSGDK